ncbi:hypothetical protein [Burkholderia cenocepacia]|uniref:hypothetical protein n=1 Tax=Burkholderia cenocepacia TaxID=95486 RepID=UPI00209A930C|nr:hypothetical protein [Burkholderia cenocepacia]
MPIRMLPTCSSPGLQQRHQVLAQARRAHHHRIAARHQQVGHFAARAQVRVQPRGFARREFQRRVADELRPAKAERAVRMAGLPVAREVQHRLRVLVLDARARLAVELRLVEPLVRRMRIHPGAQAPDQRVQVGTARRVARQHGQLAEIVGREHVGLRKRQPEQRIVRDVGPVDQLLDDITVDLERQHARDQPDLLAHSRRQPRELREVVQLRPVVRLEHGMHRDRRPWQRAVVRGYPLALG